MKRKRVRNNCGRRRLINIESERDYFSEKMGEMQVWE